MLFRSQVIILGVAVLRLVALSEPFYGVSIIVEGMMQGMGNTVIPFICNISGMWGIRIVFTFICTQLLHQGLLAAWGCMVAHNLLIFAIYAFLASTGKYIPKEKCNKIQKM